MATRLVQKEFDWCALFLSSDLSRMGMNVQGFKYWPCLYPVGRRKGSSLQLQVNNWNSYTCVVGRVFVKRRLTFSLHCCPLNSLQKRKAKIWVYVTVILQIFFVSEMSCLNQRLVIKVGVLTDKEGTCLMVVTKDLVLELLHALQSSRFPFAALRSPKVVFLGTYFHREITVLYTLLYTTSR